MTGAGGYLRTTGHLLERQVDAAAAMTDNELAQVLETPDKDGTLYTLDPLNVIDFNTEGTAMLYGIIANPPSDGAYMTDYVKAALEGIDGDTLGATYQPIEVTLTVGGQ